MPTYEFKCPLGHLSTLSQKYTQGKPPVFLDECDGSVEGPGGHDDSPVPCFKRPKRFYSPVSFWVRM